jgi:hypothetical protein
MHYHLLSDDLSLDFACNELIEFSSVSDKYSSYVRRIQKIQKRKTRGWYVVEKKKNI